VHFCNIFTQIQDVEPELLQVTISNALKAFAGKRQHSLAHVQVLLQLKLVKSSVVATSAHKGALPPLSDDEDIDAQKLKQVQQQNNTQISALCLLSKQTLTLNIVTTFLY